MEKFIPHLIAAGIVLGLILLIWIIWRIFGHIRNKIEHAHGRERIKPLTIKHLRLLSAKQVTGIFLFFLRILKYIITLILLFITVPIILSFFPATESLAAALLGYILTPLKNIGSSAVRHIPNLITIIIIVTITRYILKALKFFATRIEKGRLVIPGFYADWAHPTLKICQVFLWAFTIAIVYPYLPGSESRIFQGISVFLGILISIGSTNAIGNLIAGFIITYMRPFKIGDRVKIEDTTGFVVEKNIMVVRLKTHKNEYVTFPNIKILGNSIINYNTSSDEDEEGLIIYADITVGYSTPWEKVHEILIKAALATEHVLKKPKPYVLQTKLDDFYARYQINCYTKDVARIPAIYTRLYENIQDGFKAAGIDLTTAIYEVARNVE